MVTNLTEEQIGKIQIAEGLIYVNYGEETEKLLAPTRGGGEFTVTEKVRDIEFDGRRGKTKGLQVIEEMDASLKVTTLGADQDSLLLALAGGSESEDIIESGATGLIADTKYLTNITMFCQLIDGTYKKITLFNALHEGGLTLGAKPKAEGEIALEFNAHWDPTDITNLIYQIEDITVFPEVESI